MTEETAIRFDQIGRAQLFYTALGYKNLDVPWMVSQSAIRSTLGSTRRSYDTIFGSLLGSGEQGFIQMMLDGTLLPGRYQTTTPCFRDETVRNDFTRPYFMKTELISYQPADVFGDYEKLLNDSMSCMFELSNVEMFDIVSTDEGCDIMLNGIELGSYGVRKMNDHVWVYGTGLAEPRFSASLKVHPTTVQSDVDDSQLSLFTFSDLV